jgi:hypothetical protein
VYHTLTPWISLILAASICGFALWKGDRTIRIVAGIYLAAWILTPFLALKDPMQPEWRVMVLDTLVMVLFVGVSLWARRVWTIFAAACQMMAVASHVVSIIDLRINIATVVLGLAMLSYGVLIALLLATVGAIRARGAGHERDLELRP